MKRVFATLFAVFIKFKFIRFVYPVFFTYVVLSFANRTYQSEDLSGAFFSHKEILPHETDLRNGPEIGLYLRGRNRWFFP